jgi:23S rRNA (cytosine1962-C5)-methyltransferase
MVEVPSVPEQRSKLWAGMTQNAPYPTIKLKPVKSDQHLRGMPWFYADQIAMDRRTRNLAPGAIVNIEDREAGSLGLFAFNPLSKIAARMLERDNSQTIDATWIRAKLGRALALRDRLFDQPFYRLVHAEGDDLPGLIIDRFGDTAVFQPNAAWADAFKNDIRDALVEMGMPNVVLNASGRSRSLEGLDDVTEVVAGKVDKAVPVSMNGATYLADLIGGQKTGLYYDQRPNQAFAARLAKGAEVLDLFSHVGGFSHACLVAGASHAVAVDGSAPALALAQEGAEASGHADRFEILHSDAFDALSEYGQQGRLFDMVICDPPAFAPSKTALHGGLRAYERVALLSARLVKPGGYLVLCSCSHAAELFKFRNACMRGISRAGRYGQIIHVGTAGPDHPLHPHLAESSYLKALFFRLNG